MPKQAAPVNCTHKDREELQRWTRGGKIEKRLAQRAEIILRCLDGKTNTDVAIELKTRRLTVTKWRTRFAREGLRGLADKPRSGKPCRYDTNLRTQILKTLELPAHRGQSIWDGKSLASVTGTSDDAVWRILRKEGIQLQRCKSWCVSTDKEFAVKSSE